MSAPLSALDYLTHVAAHPPAPVCVIFGDEPYLKRRVIAALRQNVLSSDDAELSLWKTEGSATQLRDVLDELATIPMFGGTRRLAIVEDADEFVSRYRSELEEYVRRPFSGGILVLVVAQWPATTRLYKAIVEHGFPIDCKTPAPAALSKWLAAIAREQGAALASGAAEQLLEIVGTDLGQLEQELAKLALLSTGGQITPALVRDAVGGWRARTGWEMLDEACDGHAAAALDQLNRLILAGEHPIAILGQISYTLRILARATRLYIDAHAARRPVSLAEALIEAGCHRHAVRKVEPRLRRLGRDRGRQIYRWLMEADLAMKGVSSAPQRARLVLEKLLMRIAAPETLSSGSQSGPASKAG